MSSLKLLAVFVAVVNSVWAQDIARPTVEANPTRSTVIEQCESIPEKDFNYVANGSRCKINDLEIERVVIRQAHGLAEIRGWKFHSEKLDKDFKEVIWLDLESQQLGRSFSFNKKACKELMAEIPQFELQQNFIKNGGAFILSRSPFVKLATMSKIEKLNLLSSTIHENGEPLSTRLEAPDKLNFTINPARGSRDSKNVDTSLCIRTSR